MSVSIKKAVGGKENRSGISTTGGQCRVVVTYSAPNDSADVIQIQQLLNKLAVTMQPIPVNGICDERTVQGIREFQSWYGGIVDGQVDPGGTTLRRMNALAEPIDLQAISLTSPKKGAYTVAYKVETPPKVYRLLLLMTYQTCSDISPGFGLNPYLESNCMEITGKKKSRLLDKDNLSEFMTLIEQNRLWGLTGSLRLLLMKDRKLVSVSSERSFSAPIQPYAGKLTPWDIGKGDAGPKLTYIGTGKSPFIGRYFYNEKIGGKYFWKYGSTLVTENQNRGFDCITFVGSCFAVATNIGGVNPYLSSDNMATALKASYVGWEKSKTEKIVDGEGKGSLIKSYFEQAGKEGTFLLWKGSHIVLVHNKEVYEFAASKKGFVKTALKNWVGDNTSYHLCSLPADKQFK